VAKAIFVINLLSVS